MSNARVNPKGGEKKGEVNTSPRGGEGERGGILTLKSFKNNKFVAILLSSGVTRTHTQLTKSFWHEKRKIYINNLYMLTLCVLNKI